MNASGEPGYNLWKSWVEPGNKKNCLLFGSKEKEQSEMSQWIISFVPIVLKIGLGDLQSQGP